MDLDAYFTRIGYAGPARPTLDVLNGIVHAHIRAIPFENLDVLLGRPISLASDDLFRKLVHDRRGGYCFEQNGLLLEVLGAIGFEARPISARVRYQQPRDVTPARTHLFLRVEIDGESWLADVGLGGLSPTAALRLREDVEQATPHEARRLVREGTRLFHQARLGADWADVCEFTLEEMPLIDRELANWYTSTHPKSPFLQRLTAARALDGGRRLTLLNRDLTRRERDGRGETHVLADADELIDVLAREFGLRFDPGTRFECPALVW